MLIAVTGDLHLKSKYKIGRLGDSGYSVLLEDKLDTFKQFVDYCVENSVDVVYILGDIFDKINPPQWLRDLFLEALKPLIDEHIAINIVLGNHDMSYKASNLEKEIEIFGASYEVYYHTKVTKKKFDKTTFEIAPYGFDAEKLEGADILFTHTGITGGVVGFYDRPLNDYELESDVAKKYKYIISGHFHKPQKFRLAGAVVYYVGSPTPIDFAERDEDKRFLLINVGRENKIKIESVDFERKRQFIQLFVEEPSDAFDFVKLYNDEIEEGAIVKLTFKGTSLWYNSIDLKAIMEYLLNEVGVNDVKIERRLEDGEAGLKLDVQDLTDMEIIKNFGKQENLTEEEISLGMQIFEESQKEEV